MRFPQKWEAARLTANGPAAFFPARAPGNVQKDYADAHGWPDFNFGQNVLQYKEIEDAAWLYRTSPVFERGKNERVYFVSEGIDYRFDVLLNGERLLSQEGMFTAVELDLTERLRENNTLEVVIHPHPKRPGSIRDDRQEADQCVKPPVSYGWDWHPRLIPSGLWNETYLETRGPGFIRDCEARYTLSEDYSTAEITFVAACDAPVEYTLSDADGKVLYNGTEPRCRLPHPRLWWCNGQGEPYLYRWTAKTADDEKSGTIGLRTVRLVMNEGAWSEPAGFPKSRSVAPITLELNGRRIFAKGSNWVTPEAFTGTITAETYEPLVRLARDAHMNIFRCWGGSGIQKTAFYDLCDRYGILLWQEFPLACNNYVGTPDYLRVLEQEATSILLRLRRHPSVVLWCGGNELFNSWSGMTDQSLALRLLNKLCYEYDPHTPFLMTSPLCGMAHGGYTFYDDREQCDVFALFQHAHYTAYTEFGVPGLPDADNLRSFIPEAELFPIERGGAWELHHAFHAWGEERWLCMDVLRRYVRDLDSLEKVAAASQWLQCEGYKAIFEEARRQKPYCSMAVNWCYCEPWKTAANNSLISYPALPKKAYAAVAEALRPVLASARIPKFDWSAGELFSAELWLLNDQPAPVDGTPVSAELHLAGRVYPLLDWNASADAGENRLGPTVHFRLPTAEADDMTLVLRSEEGYGSAYRLCYRRPAPPAPSRQLNV